ncbi:MAG: NAD(P)H-dependent glycerol-3-phosphate dehydrogenase [Bacteroidales bacterium]
MENKKLAVLGGGSWATAIMKILLHSENQLCKTNKINWWIRDDEIKNAIEQFGHNPHYLSSVKFDPSKILIRTDLKEIIADSEILILVIPSAFLDLALHGLSSADLKNKIICSAIKGIVPQTQQVVGEYLVSQWGVEVSNFSLISGPSHAEEIALEKLTYLTAASQTPELAKMMADIFACRFVQTRVSDDIYGIEYAAVLKNIYAIAVGIAKGLGYGDNFRSVLVSNALAEMKKFLEEIHDIHRSLSSAVYLGDLLVTSYSQHSRNRIFGTMIGEGYSIQSIMLEMKMVAEGYYACASVQGIKHNMDLSMPIVEAVHEILYMQQSAPVVFGKLELILK